ncbi:MAG: DEAD/DEAH box helicase [Thermodesulfobacteriota bacterium]
MKRHCEGQQASPGGGLERGTVAEYLASLIASPRFGPQVVHRHLTEARPARHGALPPDWPTELTEALGRLGVESLYSHQAEAVARIRAGEHLVVATPTASGKSLIYNLPVLEALLADPDAKALYLFPLKALAQDQLRAFTELVAGVPAARRPRAAICDGDTTAHARKKLRDNPPQILISNPDMLHLSLLGYHEQWAEFWAGLRFVVLDEAHTYRGVFGSHLVWVLRRLARICRLYGASPQFILSSATIGNPGELAQALCGAEVAVITESGSPQGRRHFLFMDPLDSAAHVAGQLLEAAMHRGLRTIVYTQSRKMTELIAVWTGGRLKGLAGKLASYRAGYLPEERREIEARLGSGELTGVVSTSALELGIDIGGLDICILVGYPGTVMQTWQRSGRVGRSQRESLTVLVGQEDALDQFFLRNPGEFFRRPPEAAVVNPANPVIMERHLVCAVAEQPLAVNDPLWREPGVAEAVGRLAASGVLLEGASGGNWFTNRRYPHREVDLRGSGQGFVISEAGSNEVVGQVDGGRVLKECHPGAVYLHQGQTWLVLDLDLPGHRVVATRRQVNYFTRTTGGKETEILEEYERRQTRYFSIAVGRLRITETVTGFERRLVRGQKLISRESLDLPPQVLDTEGVWLIVPAGLRQRLEHLQQHFMGGIHALEHGVIGVFPLVVLCDRNDVGGIAIPCHPQLGEAAVFIYDGHGGGVGLARQAFRDIDQLLALALTAIATCSCENGCPSCVHSPKCGSGNRPIDKGAARILLEGLLRGWGEDLPVAEEDSRSMPLPDAWASGQAPCLGEATPAIVAAPAAGQIGLPRLAGPPVPRRYVVFDLETKRSAEEVGGWGQASRMGVSVGVAYDSASDSFLTFFEEEIDGLVSLLGQAELVVGFNNSRFDNLVLSAYTDTNLAGLPSLDILQQVRSRLGYRLSLDHLAEQTLGIRKSGDGLQALSWYRQGEMTLLAEYCKKDVEITRDLYRYGLRHGYLLFRNKAGMQVRCPVVF